MSTYYICNIATLYSRYVNCHMIFLPNFVVVAALYVHSSIIMYCDYHKSFHLKKSESPNNNNGSNHNVVDVDVVNSYSSNNNGVNNSNQP